VSPVSRRQLLKLFGVTVVAGGLVTETSMSAARATDDGTYPRNLWEPIAGNPVATSAATKEGDRQFCTMLPLGRYIANPLDAWYLWAWRHDSFPRLQLYTAPSPEGPFTDRGFYQGPPAPGYPAGYDQTHFSSGDIVWDPIGHRLIATPHSIRTSQNSGNAEPCQDSFLMESRDGVTWSWLDGDNSPRLLCGPPGSIDSIHTGYGRLLRDLDGWLTTFQGRYWWIYRAQRHDAAAGRLPTLTTYTPALASSPSLSAHPWRKEGKAFDTVTQDNSFIGMGSFLAAAGSHFAYYAFSGIPGSVIPGAVEQMLAQSTAGTMTFTLPSQPVTLPNAGLGFLTNDVPNLIRDPDTGVQYLAVADLVPDVNNDQLDVHHANPLAQYEIRIYKAVVA
jgi:hypothetical protein